MQKKVIVFISSPSGKHVREYLLETLKTMDMVASEEMSYVVHSAKKEVSENGEILNPAFKKSLTHFLKNQNLI